MKKIFIKYNPYSLKSELTVEGKSLAQNSRVGEVIKKNDTRMQEWIEELPQMLIDECNDVNFDITFHGTLLDYEDLAEVFTSASKQGYLTAKLTHIPAKETSDKELLIDEVFQKIQKGPFEELKDAAIQDAFEAAKSKDFPVCVVATMSAGKSTLINAMLKSILMPSKQEACTAIITKIHDNDTKNWKVKVFNKEGQLIEFHENVDYKTMGDLNSNENVSRVEMYGDIPFVDADEASLVLVDTPGPNNSRDPRHKEIQNNYLKDSAKPLMLYVMESTYSTMDNNTLLQQVADSMKVRGRQSKERFIFVVNKLDGRRPGTDDDIQGSLDGIRMDLKKYGIENPNLFPAAALPALDIRLWQAGADISQDCIYSADFAINRLNNSENLHLEKYAPLPASIKENINSSLVKAIEAGDEKTQAVIHTGIPSIEAAIRQYIRKYAKTGKVKNIVDQFIHKLEEAECQTKIENEVAKNIEERDRVKEQITLIRKKVNDIKAAKDFQSVVDEAVTNISDESKKVVNNIVKKFQEKITEKLRTLKGIEIDVKEINDELERLERFAKKLEPDFQTDLEDLIQESIIKTGSKLIEEYKEKLVALTEEISPELISGIRIEPLKLMGGSVMASDNFTINRFIKKKSIEDGEEWVANTNKKWYKPWTWFQESGYYRTKYKTVKYVNGDEVAQAFLMPIKDALFENGESACTHALHEAQNIAKMFTDEFKRLDGVLKEKLDEIEKCATDEKEAEKRINEAEKKLKWLDEIKAEVESILEI